MIGLTKPTSGAAYVQGLDIRTHMDGIYTSMGVCPQHKWAEVPSNVYVFPEIQFVSIGKVSKFISHDIVACCGKAWQVENTYFFMVDLKTLKVQSWLK